MVESTEGFRSLELTSHESVYMIGSSAQGDYLTPTQVTSLADFTNVFGASPSEAPVKLFFRNDRRGILYFVRTPIASRKKVTITSATTGAYTLVVNGTNVTYTATGSDTLDTIASGLLAAVNNSSVASAVTAVTGSIAAELVIRADNPLATTPTVTVGAGTMTVADATPTNPTATDYVYGIENSFDVADDWSQGFLIAPQAFQLLTSQSDRLSVANAMQTLASDAEFDWVALIDTGSGLTLEEAKAEGLLVNAPEGHSAVYYPYLTDLEDGVVPPSAGVAGLATRRFKEEGFQQPFAGAKFPVLGVKDVVTKVSTQEQEVVNPLGLNVIRNLRNKGVVVWAMRTRSNSEFYKFIHTRVIMNVVNGTLRRGFDNQLFTAIDGFGIYLNAISQTASRLLRRLWNGKALFGATEAEAFEVVCDFTNNTQDELEQGNVLVEIYVVPSPAAERILINTIRVSAGYLPRSTSNLESSTTTTDSQ